MEIRRNNIFFGRWRKLPEKPEWLIVGLGNIGEEYLNTRHNAGFIAVDQLAKKTGALFTCNFHDALIASVKVSIRGVIHNIMLCKPQTFMNNSGEPVLALIDEFSIDANKTIVILDDFHLPLGQIRIRAKGSSGGHNGLKSVSQCLGHSDYPRIRIGIGSKYHEKVNFDNTIDFVLGEFKKEELGVIDETVPKVTNLIFDWIENGVECCQNKYN